VCKLLKHPFINDEYPSNLEISYISNKKYSITRDKNDNSVNNNLEDSKLSNIPE